MSKTAGPGCDASERSRIRFLFLLAAVGILLLAVASYVILRIGFDHASTQSTSPSFNAASFRHARRLVDYEQPSPALAQAISVVHQAEDRDPANLPPALSGLDVVLIDDVPFFQYWQNTGDDQYIFHPLAYGRVLLRLVADPGILRYLDKAVAMGHTLPNGGLLWYYPDNYDLSRFLGPDLAPSAIAQGVILEAVTTIDYHSPTDLSALSRAVFEGLAYDYYRGA